MAQGGGRVLIACPTGVLVSGYRDRLPSGDRVVAETIHSARRFPRVAASDPEARVYAPPARLRTYDVIFLDEISQLEDGLFEHLLKVARLFSLPFVFGGGVYAGERE